MAPALMTTLAAVVEGFWSAQRIDPIGVKYAFGIAGWILCAVYFLMAGRRAPMRLENVTAEIRPRSDWEAVDLGLALVRRDFWRCFSVWWLAVLVPTAAGGLVALGLSDLVADVVLVVETGGLADGFVRVEPAFVWRGSPVAASLREIPRAWTRRFFHRFLSGAILAVAAGDAGGGGSGRAARQGLQAAPPTGHAPR
jgi:hypothetical protein